MWYSRGRGRDKGQKLCTTEDKKIKLVNFCDTYNNFPSKASEYDENFMMYDI